MRRQAWRWWWLSQSTGQLLLHAYVVSVLLSVLLWERHESVLYLFCFLFCYETQVRAMPCSIRMYSVPWTNQNCVYSRLAASGNVACKILALPFFASAVSFLDADFQIKPSDQINCFSVLLLPCHVVIRGMHTAKSAMHNPSAGCMDAAFVCIMRMNLARTPELLLSWLSVMCIICRLILDCLKQLKNVSRRSWQTCSRPGKWMESDQVHCWPKHIMMSHESWYWIEGIQMP